MLRNIRASTGHPLPGPGADPPRYAAFWRVRPSDRPRSGHTPQSRIAIHVPLVPERDRLSRHREFARLRPSPGGQWLCRAVHPYPEGEPAVGRTFKTVEDLCQALLEFARPATRLADRAPRLPHPGAISTKAASN